MTAAQRLIVVSNRLPITVEREGGQARLQPSSGGLVTALRPILDDTESVWIGWPGSAYSPEIAGCVRQSALGQCALAPVYLTPAEKALFYDGWCNQILWPLFHDLQTRCRFDPAYWDACSDVTEKFADAVEQTARRDDFVWVHDYHLMMLAEALHARDLPLRPAYFHHIPFPQPEIFEKLPWRREVLLALLHFQSVGFQTTRDRANFVASVRRCLREVHIKRVGDHLLVRAEGLSTRAGTFPISIDFEQFATGALDQQVAAKAAAIQRDIRGEQIILGVDRLDYTKGIPERLLAFRALLEDHPELRGRVTLIQVVVPSRAEIPAYRDLKLSIERLVSEINGHYAAPGWTPIVYMYRCLARAEMIALYRAADIALVTPLKDGMNLVAKEFCASRVDNGGVLILSEFAGAARELKGGALLANPYDTRGVALALYRAFMMSGGEQRVRMQTMRSWIQQHDVFRWCESFCAQAAPFRRGRTVPAALPPLQPEIAVTAGGEKARAASLLSA